VFDHRHVNRGRRLVPYVYRGPVQLLEDFYAEVERILRERGGRAAITGGAEQNLLRTLKKLESAGVVRLDKGVGRARRPVLTARRVHFEIDLLTPV
jgi:predicted transcriptional regulator